MAQEQWSPTQSRIRDQGEVQDTTLGAERRGSAALVTAASADLGRHPLEKRGRQ